MNHEQGVIYVLIEHFVRHLYPRATQMEKKLDAGERLDDFEIDHVAQVLEELRLVQPLINRHPEHRELAESVVALYTGLARRASQNEAATTNRKVGE